MFFQLQMWESDLVKGKEYQSMEKYLWETPAAAATLQTDLSQGTTIENRLKLSL